MGKEQTENERKYLIRADDLGDNSDTDSKFFCHKWSALLLLGQAAQKQTQRTLHTDWLRKNDYSGLYYSPQDSRDLFPGFKPAVFDLLRHMPFQKLKQPWSLAHVKHAQSQCSTAFYIYQWGRKRHIYQVHLPWWSFRTRLNKLGSPSFCRRAWDTILSNVHKI